MEILLDLLLKQGLVGGLFVWLLYDTRKESAKREEKLMSFLDKVTNDICQIKDDISNLLQGKSHE